MLLYFEPMLRGPESEFHFDPKGQLFKTTPLVDLRTGVVTEWEKRIRGVGAWLVRRDSFPNGPQRVVTRSEYSFGEGLPLIREKYSVIYVVGSIKREIKLDQDPKDPNSVDVELSLMRWDEQESLFFYVGYTREGILSQFDLSSVPNGDPSDTLLSFDGDPIEYFEDRSLEENLGELVRIFKTRGEGVLWKDGGFADQDTQFPGEFELSEIEKELGKWPQGLVTQARRDIFGIIGITLAKYLRSELSNEEMQTFLSALTPQVTELVFQDFERWHGGGRPLCYKSS